MYKIDLNCTVMGQFKKLNYLNTGGKKGFEGIKEYEDFIIQIDFFFQLNWRNGYTRLKT